jgi:hypothetical protein
VAIEAKAPGKNPTTRQLHTMAEIFAAGGIAMCVDGSPARMARLEELLTLL